VDAEETAAGGVAVKRYDPVGIGAETTAVQVVERGMHA
jgi:hypothetical protein